MSEFDGLALAWAVALCAMLCGLVPFCWPLLFLPLFYFPVRLLTAFATGFVEALIAAVLGNRR